MLADAEKSKTWGPRQRQYRAAAGRGVRPYSAGGVSISSQDRAYLRRVPSSNELLNPWALIDNNDGDIPATPRMASTSLADLNMDREEDVFYRGNSDVIHLAVAVYSFEGNPQHHELPFFELDTMLVVNTQGGDGWWEAYLLGTQYRVNDIALDDGSQFDVDDAEKWKHLPEGHPVRAASRVKLHEWDNEDWNIVENAPYGFVPASYIVLLASITRDYKEWLPHRAVVEGREHELPDESFKDQEITNVQQLPLLQDAFPELHLRRFQSFHPFVTSGVEAYILGYGNAGASGHTGDLLGYIGSFLNGKQKHSSSASSNISESMPPCEYYRITSGPAWAVDLHKTNFSNVIISDPEHRRSWGGFAEWTIYRVSCTLSDRQAEGLRLSVARRFSHFQMLHDYMQESFSALLIPDLPSSPYAGRFREKFLLKRMRALERWLSRVIRHPVLGSSDGLQAFLSAGAVAYDLYSAGGETDEGLCFVESLFKIREHVRKDGTMFLSRVLHPEFNLPPSDGHIVYMEDFLGDGFEMERMQQFHAHLSNQAALLHAKLLAYLLHTTDHAAVAFGDLGTSFRSLLLSPASSDYSCAERTASSRQNDPNQPSWCHKGAQCTECAGMTNLVLHIAMCLGNIPRMNGGLKAERLSEIIDIVDEWSVMNGRFAVLMQIYSETLNIGQQVLSESRRCDVDCPIRTDAVAQASARLTTVFNVLHAELLHWFHNERYFEWSSLISSFISAEIDALDKARNALSACQNLVR